MGNLDHTTRLSSPDQIKTAAIFGVVFIHASYLLGSTPLLVKVCMNIFRFDVPCFIMIWAFFFERSYARRTPAERRTYTVERFRPLVKDYLVWTIIYFFVFVDWSTLTPARLVTSHLAGYGWSGQYFFIVLFQLLLLHPLIRLVYRYRWLRYLAIALTSALLIAFSYGQPYLPDLITKFGERPFFFWIPYVFAGIALARNEMPRLPRWSWLTIFLVPLEFYVLDRLGIGHTSHITPVVVVSSILLFGSVLQRDSWVEGPVIDRITGFMGGNTLIVFLANPLVIYLLEPVLLPLLSTVRNPVALLLILTVLAIGIIGVCLLLGEIKERTKAAVLNPVRG